MGVTGPTQMVNNLFTFLMSLVISLLLLAFLKLFWLVEADTGSFSSG